MKLAFNQTGNFCIPSEQTPNAKVYGSENNSHVLGTVTLNAEMRTFVQNPNANGTTLPFGVRGFPRPGVTTQRPYLNPDIGSFSPVEPNMVQGILNETVYTTGK